MYEQRGEGGVGRPLLQVCHRPTCWRAGRRVPIRMELLGASFALFFTVGTVGTQVGPGVPLSSQLIAGWLASIFLSTLVFPLGERIFGGRGADELVPRNGATRLRFAPHEVPALVVVCLVGAAFGAGVVATMSDYDFLPGVVAGALFAAYFLYYPLLVALRRIRRGWLDLSPTDVTMRGWGYTATVRWDDVTGVEARGGAPAIALRIRGDAHVDVVRHVRWGRIDWPVSRRAAAHPAPRPGEPRPSSRTGLVIPLDRFAIDPALVFCLVHT